MKRVLLTGASGFIGRQCIPLLAVKGYEVHAITRHLPSANTPSHAIWHQVDLLSPGGAGEAIERIGPKYLLHLAWYAIPGKFWKAPENLDWVRASLELFRAFATGGGTRLVAAGSCSEYASCAGECVEGQTLLAPATLYGSSKHVLERTLHSWCKEAGVSAAWGRIFYLYGPHEDPSRLVAYAIGSLLRGEPALCSEGLQVLDFLRVQDVASAFVALLESNAQGPVNIGSGNPVEVRYVLGEIGRQIGRPELIRLGARPSTSPPDRWWANTAKLSREVGWKPEVDLQSGLSDAIQWWKSLEPGSTQTHGQVRAK
jgi:nucleoside-diphosphate-sugar epimerase